MDHKITFSVTRRKLRLALALMVAVAVLAPVAVFAAGGTFTDDDSSIFEGDIEWMAANGITSGCGAGLYCPDDNVTRGQMAAFMKRLSEKKVVNAATAETLGGMAAGDFAPSAHNHSASAITNGPGVAASGDDSGAMGAALAEIASVTLTAPSNGYLLVSGDMQLNIAHTNGTASIATVGLSLSPTTLDQTTQDNAAGVPSTAGTGNYFQSAGLTGVFPVSAGNVTVYILGSENPGTTASWNDATITALFVPTAYGVVDNESAPTEGTDAAD